MSETLENRASKLNTQNLLSRGCYLYLLGTLLVVLLAACQPRAVPVDLPDDSFKPEKILVLPFTNMADIYGEGQSVRCPLCGTMMTTGEVKEGADGFLTAQLSELLSKQMSSSIISSDRAKGVYTALLDEEGLLFPEVGVVAKTGRHLGADAVIVGNIYRFRERVGSDFGAKRPASVAFTLAMIRVDDKSVVWTGVFDETQQSLMENLFNIGTFFKRRGKWLTAGELAVFGLRDMLKELPNS